MEGFPTDSMCGGTCDGCTMNENEYCNLGGFKITESIRKQ